MLIKDVVECYRDSYIYMERFINKGSPSGYTFKYTPSIKYSPLHGERSFSLPFFLFPKDSIVSFGDLPKSFLKFFGNDEFPFFIHPDVLQSLIKKFDSKIFEQFKVGEIDVAPTANGRTVVPIKENLNLFIKLHYDDIIGRCNRSLPYQKAVAGVELSNITAEHLLDIEDDDFSILKESYSSSINNLDGNNFDIGLVIREFDSFKYSVENRFLIPFFSLISKDQHKPEDKLLLFQILEHYDNPMEMIFERLTKPLLKFYTSMVFDLGFIPELNAQNLLYEINSNLEVKRPVFRDFQGVEKDLSLRENLSLECNFESYPYKCIVRDDSNYFIRHSFSYDFKLGEYIFEEIADFALKFFNYNKENFRNTIKEQFHNISNGREKEHFLDDNIWYSHDKILLTNERPYLKNLNPKYRRGHD